ncbi:hypothetical protein M9434_004606 [Picochlorum sp. BPE23]|nr:hypothetical protein M9434_004606 [Picochlorum sp. BPE23]
MFVGLRQSSSPQSYLVSGQLATSSRMRLYAFQGIPISHVHRNRAFLRIIKRSVGIWAGRKGVVVASAKVKNQKGGEKALERQDTAGWIDAVLKPVTTLHRRRREDVEANFHAATVANQSLGGAQQTRTQWTVFMVGMATLAVATGSLVYRIYKVMVRRRDSSVRRDVSEESMSSMDDRTISAMAPLLLAAETGAEVDETDTMSSDDLIELEVNLRTLITSMDAQLSELKESLQETVLPAEALEELDTMMLEDGMEWEEFALYARYCSDEEKRTYRSLLFNRSVQSKLLEQVERQMSSRNSDSLDEMCDQGSRESAEDNNGVGAVRVAVAGATEPHAHKAETGGEDAFFADNDLMVFGIADGVGGWATSGIDPAEYSRELIAKCEAFAQGNRNARQILEKAFSETDVPGSCTIILAKYVDSNLDVVSLGDCSMRLLRDGKVLYSTDIQEHAWNQPFQLSSPSFNRANLPHDALEYNFDIQAGDIAVLGSDGFWDNIWDEEMEEAIAAGIAAGDGCHGDAGWQLIAEDVSQRLVQLAEEHSIDAAYESPFADEKQKLETPAILQRFLPPGVGGKMDDITVVVACFF